MIVVSLAVGVYGIRRGNVRLHRGCMIGAFCGLAGTFAPGRVISAFMFGG